MPGTGIDLKMQSRASDEQDQAITILIIQYWLGAIFGTLVIIPMLASQIGPARASPVNNFRVSIESNLSSRRTRARQ